MAILVVGSVAIDTIETPFGSVDSVQGGAASYFALAASLYDTVRLVAVVGEDFPPPFLASFQARGVDLRGLRVMSGATFRWGGRYHLDMNSRDTLFTELGVFADFRPDIPDAYHDSAVIFLANIQPQLQLEVLRQMTVGAPASRLIALDTMNLWIETARDALTDVLRQVDIVLIAEEEARQYAGTTSLRAAVRHLFSLGPKVLVVKQGSYGALLFSADGRFFAAPAYPLEDVRDPTGAGDAFAGGFLGYLSSRITAGHPLSALDYRRALVHGNILGSFACEDFSVARVKALTPSEIAARYREFVDYTHFEGTWSSEQ
ncbi:MAG: sugar kinase [Ktedonobacterales bacterium]|nr:sugar kinase [Ktedonobacterales bacterium]